MSTWHKWTIPEDRVLKASIADRICPKQIAINLNRDIRSVYGRMERLGLTLHRRQRPPILENKIKLTLAESQQISDLAAAANIHKSQYLQQLIRNHLRTVANASDSNAPTHALEHARQQH